MIYELIGAELGNFCLGMNKYSDTYIIRCHIPSTLTKRQIIDYTDTSKFELFSYC